MAAPLASTQGTVSYTAAPNYSFPAAAPAYSFPMVGTQTLSAAPAYTFPSATPVMAQAPTISYATAAPVYQTVAPAAPVYQTPVVEAGPLQPLLVDNVPFVFTADTPVTERVVETEVEETAAPSASYAAQLFNLIRGGSAAKPVVAEQVVAEPVVAEPIVAEPVVAEPVVAAPVVAAPVVAAPVVAEPVVAAPVVEIKVVEPAVVDSEAASPVEASPVTYSAPVQYASLEELLANSNNTQGATTGSYYLPSSASMIEVRYMTPAVKVEDETLVATDGVVKKVVTKKKIGCC